MPTVEEQLKSLQSTVMFQGVTYEKLTTVLNQLKVESFPAGTVLFESNTMGSRVYLIDRGAIRISRVTAYGDETTLDVLGRGEVVGELSSLDGLSRSARATCLEDTLLFSFSREHFEQALRENPQISFNLLREMSRRIRKADDNIVRRLEEQRRALEAQLTKLHKLMDASKMINSTLDLDKLLGLILEAAVSSIEADRGTLYIVDHIKQELWSKVLQGANMVEIRLPIGKGIAGYVAQTGETINIPDAYSDPRFNREVDQKTGYRTRNILCMAMRNRDGRIIGVFQLLNKKAGSFSKDDEQFIDAFSSHAVIALENARLAQEMIQNERLSAVGRMANVIIHDIKNPMGTLRVYAQVMKKKSGNEEAGKLADEMIRQVDRFVNMTQEILDFTRGVSSLNMQDLEFGGVMDGVLDFIEKDLEKNNVKLERKAAFKGLVKLDQDKMVRVFYNLASNARDAMPQGGTLTVSTVEDNGSVRIEFADTGTGMPEEVRKRIFEPFMTYGKKHGTGLGMAIVKKIIDDHLGTVGIESTLGKGTTIRITLPAIPS
jgi:signal transduction histidine kinase/CRP-like cAMP-binding protein